MIVSLLQAMWLKALVHWGCQYLIDGNGLAGMIAHCNDSCIQSTRCGLDLCILIAVAEYQPWLAQGEQFAYNLFLVVDVGRVEGYSVEEAAVGHGRNMCRVSGYDSHKVGLINAQGAHVAGHAHGVLQQFPPGQYGVFADRDLWAETVRSLYRN